MIRKNPKASNLSGIGAKRESRTAAKNPWYCWTSGTHKPPEWLLYSETTLYGYALVLGKRQAKLRSRLLNKTQSIVRIYCLPVSLAGSHAHAILRVGRLLIRYQTYGAGGARWIAGHFPSAMRLCSLSDCAVFFGALKHHL